MKTYGLIGFPLSHSFSQKYFKEKFQREKILNREFKNFSLESIDEFPSLIKQNPNLAGLSVTIPYKQSVIRFLEGIDATAKKIGAVNCVRVSDRKGFNTDIIGFMQSIQPLLKPYHHKALILGSGGASKAIQYVLKKMKIDYYLVSRIKNKDSKNKTYSDLNQEIIAAHSIIINATPLGMFPDINNYPRIPYEFLTPKHLLYDLNYNPQETLFLKKGKEKGAQIKNGLEMLHVQAEKAWEIWNK